MSSTPLKDVPSFVDLMVLVKGGVEGESETECHFEMKPRHGQCWHDYEPAGDPMETAKSNTTVMKTRPLL